ncbi:scarecrow-like protein 9 [Forsythia ovata]|uniref:Scarecrow-like protein 9 n=1 Tax=Forsythia ovata TaxID=205694 RepID=A0ABD1T7A6_9LAMI
MPVEEFSIVLLHSKEEGEEKLAAYRADLRNAMSRSVQQNRQPKRYRGKERGKKQKNKKEVIDLRTLLINCAQAVAADDCRSANELLKQFRQHSSPFGDGNQRWLFILLTALKHVCLALVARYTRLLSVKEELRLIT